MRTMMGKWAAEDIPGFKPCNRIVITGNTIIEIDLNTGWEITNVEFNDMIPAKHLDKLIVTFEKKKGDTSEI